MSEVINIRSLRGRDARTYRKIDRSTKWGNPFVIGRDGDRAEVIESYRQWLSRRPGLVNQMQEELAGYDLACWCAPLPCHGDVILDMIGER